MGTGLSSSSDQQLPTTCVLPCASISLAVRGFNIEMEYDADWTEEAEGGTPLLLSNKSQSCFGG